MMNKRSPLLIIGCTEFLSESLSNSIIMVDWLEDVKKQESKSLLLPWQVIVYWEILRYARRVNFAVNSSQVEVKTIWHKYGYKEITVIIAMGHSYSNIFFYFFFSLIDVLGCVCVWGGCSFLTVEAPSQNDSVLFVPTFLVLTWDNHYWIIIVEVTEHIYIQFLYIKICQTNEFKQGFMNAFIFLKLLQVIDIRLKTTTTAN